MHIHTPSSNHPLRSTPPQCLLITIAVKAFAACKHCGFEPLRQFAAAGVITVVKQYCRDDYQTVYLNVNTSVCIICVYMLYVSSGSVFSDLLFVYIITQRCSRAFVISSYASECGCLHTYKTRNFVHIISYEMGVYHLTRRYRRLRCFKCL